MSTPHPHYPHVFRPIRIGSVEIRNRMYMTPHAIANLVMPDPDLPGFFLPAPGAVDYYVARARGGVGLIIQGATVVHPTAQATIHLEAFAEHSVPHFRRIAEAVKEQGAAMFMQLMHGGNHADWTSSFGGPLSASDVPGVEATARFQPRPLAVEQIHEIVEGFARSAANARAAGYDGIMLHASHSYLIEQFLSPFYNHRTDHYGGCLENRMRFLFEILEATRQAIGPEMALGVRLIADEALPGGLGPQDIKHIATALDTWGVDFIDLGPIGTYHSIHLLVPSVFMRPLHAIDAIRAARPDSPRAVIMCTPTRLGSPEDAEELIASGVADMVGATRSYFADPELVAKAEAGQADTIRPCIALNSCSETLFCAVNPTHRRERHWKPDELPPALSRKRVVVVGGGPAGMEAARVAGLRGHEVVLIERAVQIGGGINLIAAVPGREPVSRAVAWWAGRLEELGVVIYTGKEATAEMVIDEAPDAVIVATGARWDRSGATAFLPMPIPGSARDFVVTPEEAITDPSLFSGRVIVFDDEGHQAGVGVAELLGKRGVRVEIVTRWPQLAFRLEPTNQIRYVIPRLQAAGVNVSTSTYLGSIEDDRAILYDVHTGKERIVDEVGGVVMVTGRHSVDDLATQLAGRISEVHVIGDAWRPRLVADATVDGYGVGREL